MASPIWQARLEPDEDAALREYCRQHDLSRSQAVRLGLQLLQSRSRPPKGGHVAMGPKPRDSRT